MGFERKIKRNQRRTERANFMGGLTCPNCHKKLFIRIKNKAVYKACDACKWQHIIEMKNNNKTEEVK